MNASRRVYTPQFLMNGCDYRLRRTFNSDVNRINGEKADVTIHLEVARADPSQLQIKVQTEHSTGKAHNVWLAVYENDLQSQVSDGENEGRLLHHDYVVRKLQGPFAINDAGGEVNTTLTSDGAHGSMSQVSADEIWAWGQSMDNYRQCWLFHFPSHPFHGAWLEGAGPTTLTLDPGMGFWYRHKGTSGWTWDIPVPY